MNQPYSYDFGPFQLVPSERLLSRNGQSVLLAPIAFDLLRVLVENAGKLMTRDELLGIVWPDTHVEPGRVESTVSEIKKALGGSKAEYVENVRRSGRKFEGGYRFVAPVVANERSTKSATIRCPFPGLLPFYAEDSDCFFGRQAEIERLILKLTDSNFIAVLGPSGVGKSSLVRAGLTRELKSGRLNGSETWAVRIFEPGPQPLRELAKQLLQLTSPTQDSFMIDALLNNLRAERNTIDQEISDYFSKHPECPCVLWIVDQFEEVFTQCRDEAEQTQFIACLQALRSSTRGRNVILLTLRADYYLAVLSRTKDEFRILAREIAANQIPMGPPNEEDLRRVITEPANLVGLEYETGLVDKILSDLTGQPGALPSLAHTLRELFDRREGHTLTFKAYQETGGVTGSIAKRADLTYEKFSADWQRITRRIMVRLSERAQVEDVLGRARQRITINELAPTPKDRDSVEEVVRTLADARLLITSIDERTGDTWVQVAHDALIRNWPSLRDWLWEDRAALRIHRRLLQASAVWQERPNEDLLYRRSTLTEANNLLKERDDLFGDPEREFLIASERLEQKENHAAVIRRWVVRGGIAGVLLAIILGYIVYQVQRQRDLATSLRLAAESARQQEIDPELSLLLAMEAAKLRATKQAEAALRQALAAPYVKTVLQHGAQVISALPSNDGRYVITASADKTARIWNPLTGQLVRTLTGHDDWVNWATFSTDSKFVVTASSDKTAIIWDAQSGKILITLRGHESRVNNAAFNREGNRIVTASGDKTARVWDVHTGQELFKLGAHTEWLNSAVFSPDGKLIITASGDKTARVWDADSGRQLAVLEGHEGSVLNAAFSPDGQFVATASVDRTARIWDVKTWKAILELRGHTANVNDAEFSADGKWIATASKDGTVLIWNAHTGQSILALHGHRSAVNTATFSPDGRFVFSASGDGTARVWVIRSPEDTSVLRGHTDAVYSAIFSPDGTRLVTASKDGSARVWDVSTGKEVLSLNHPKAVQNAVFSPDGSLIATADEDARGRIWDARTGILKKELIGHTELIHAIAFNSDGTLVATASKDKTARIWNAQTGECIKILQGHSLDVATAVFSKDGGQILTASRDNTVRLWNTSTWQSYEWKIGTGFVNGAAFSPDNKYVVAACADQTARIWDPLSHEVVSVLRGHEQWVNYAEFSPDGVLVVSASGDHTARIWDFSSGQTLVQLDSYDNTVMGAAFSPDGRLVATASTDNSAQLYKCPICGTTVQDLLRLAEGRARRTLTPEERERFLKLQ